MNSLIKTVNTRMENRVQIFNIKKFMVAFFLATMTTAALASDNISMFLGEIKIIEVGTIDRVAVGKGELLSTTMLENGQLLLLAEKNGETTVHIWYSDGSESDIKVQVLVSDQDRLVHELQTLLADLPDIEVKVVGQKIFLTGHLNCVAGQESCEESKTIQTVQGVYKDVINLTRVNAQLAPVILPSSKMVSMSVKITEFNTSDLSNLGIDWSDAISGPGAGLAWNAISNDVFGASSPEDVAPSFAGNPLLLTGASPLAAVGIATEIISRINLLVSTGDALILAEPRLSARSGGKAEFLAGGEIPVVTSSLSGTDVEYKEFGIILKVSPIIDDENNIMASVNTEVSAVDLSNAVGGVPAFLTRKTTTDVSMRDGDTLVLSGLIDRTIGEDIEKFPVLGDIPILGALFRSTDYRNKLTELVIFITPTVFDAKSQFNRDNVQRSQDLINEFTERIDREDVILD